jgi:hypothetical protein
MKLNNGINYKASFDQLYSDQFDLLSYLTDKLVQIDESSENIVLLTHKKE